MAMNAEGIDWGCVVCVVDTIFPLTPRARALASTRGFTLHPARPTSLPDFARTKLLLLYPHGAYPLSVIFI